MVQVEQVLQHRRDQKAFPLTAQDSLVVQVEEVLLAAWVMQVPAVTQEMLEQRPSGR